MADKRNWAAVAEKLGLTASGLPRKPRFLNGEMDGITVRVAYRTREGDHSTGLYAVLPPGLYDSYRFSVNSRVMFKLRPSRYVDTGDANFDQLFSVKTGKDSADYVTGFLNPRRRAALIEAGPRVKLYCNLSWAGRPQFAPEGKSLLSTWVRGRANESVITETLNMLVDTARRLAD